jgi:acyl carrier protein
VEAVLTAQAGVRAAAVVLRKDERTGPRLCAYVVPGDGYPGSGALHKELRRLLPEFMVPSSYVELLALPLSPSGKVDRKALPEPDRQAVAAVEYVAPRTATETAIARIWAELLGLDRVGVDDDFFALGGHSLVATRVMARLSAELGISLPLHAFFEAPTVAGLALRIAEELATGDEALLARLDRIGDAELEAMSEAELARFLEDDEPGS